MIVYCCDKTPSAEIGGKGAGLFKLLGYGFKVPEFFVITADTGIYNDRFREELNGYADMLDCDLFAVRSSGIAEDGANASYAGQFITELNVKRENLFDAVRRVAGSFSASGAASYGKRFGQNDNGRIAIIVQKQIIGKVSGVMFSTSPHSVDEVLIESVSGCGENLVGGKITPIKRAIKKTHCNEEGYVRELACAAELLEREEKTAVDVEWSYDGKQLWFLQLRPQTVGSDVLPSGLEKKDWKLYVKRDFTVFNHSIQEVASDPDTQKLSYGFGMPIYEGLIVCGREFYTERNDERCCRDWAKLDNSTFFKDFIARIDRSLSITLRRTSAVVRRDFSRLSDKSLIKAYKNEIQHYIESYIPMMIRPDDYLFGELIKAVGESKARRIVNAISVFTEKTLYSEERRLFLLAVIHGEKDKYLKKYAWITSPLGVNCTAFTESDFDARAKEFTLPRAKKALKELLDRKREERTNAEQYLREEVNAEITQLCEYILKFMYFRTRTAEVSDRYFYYIRKILLAEICRRFSLIDRDLLALRYDEIEQYVKSPAAFTNIVRKHKGGEVIVCQDGKSKAYYGAYSYGLLKKILSSAKKTTDNFIKGEIACAGEVTARVVVINGIDDIYKMEDGYILVTSMTTPELVVALDKAVGIITDEGGITCHASILAREYGVPCLVGTQSATRLLKDGMTVRLDCINGGFEIVT